LQSFAAVKKKLPLEPKLRRSSTQHCAAAEAMGFAWLYPSYALVEFCEQIILGVLPRVVGCGARDQMRADAGLAASDNTPAAH
jgi:hypothetical protein